MKSIKYLLLVILAVSLFSCYKDEGNYDYTDVGDIEIADFTTGMQFVSGLDTLKISPQISSEFSSANLEYRWLLYNDKNEVDTIGTERNLDYPVNLGTGDYSVYLYVKNTENGLYRHTSTVISVITAYSQGFYLLKEVSGGYTDLDLFKADGTLISDVLLKTQGNPVQGEPFSLGILYDHPFIDPDTQTKTYGTCLGLVTASGKAEIYRTSDMAKMFDQQTMYYGESTDIPYKFFTTMYYDGYLSSGGLYTQSLASSGSGLYGYPDGSLGGGEHYAYMMNSLGMIYWNDNTKQVIYTNYAQTPKVLSTMAYATSASNYECVYMGPCPKGAYGLFKDTSTSKLYLYYFTVASAFAVPKMSKYVEVTSSSLLYNASVIGSNERVAQFIYFVNGNKTYCYDATSNAEFPVSFDGLPENEEITYFTNRFDYNTDEPFDYIDVATYKDGKYKLYMYETVGGLPAGEPVLSAEGEGKLKEVHYLNRSTPDLFWELYVGYLGMQYGYSR